MKLFKEVSYAIFISSQTTFTGSIGHHLTQVSGPVSAKTDENISVTATIKNQGTGVANSAPHSVYLSTDTLIDGTDVCLGSFFTYELAVGASNTFNHNVSISTPGTYYLGAIAGDSCGISSTIESDESNNTLVGNPITISEPVVDIAVTDVSGPSRARQGESIEVYGTVSNLGPDTANNFRVNIYLSTDAVITSSDTLLNGSQFTLNGGESITFSRTVLVPDSIARGDYYLGAIGDATNIYLEANETNNSFLGNLITIR